jgi:hypothetical protein
MPALALRAGDRTCRPGLALRRSTAAFDEPWRPACSSRRWLSPLAGEVRNEPWASVLRREAPPRPPGSVIASHARRRRSPFTSVSPAGRPSGEWGCRVNIISLNYVNNKIRTLRRFRVSTLMVRSGAAASRTMRPERGRLHPSRRTFGAPQDEAELDLGLMAPEDGLQREDCVSESSAHRLGHIRAHKLLGVMARDIAPRHGTQGRPLGAAFVGHMRTARGEHTPLRRIKR